MSEKYLEAAEVRTMPDAHLRLLIEALLKYLRVEVMMDSTPEATAFLVRRIHLRPGRKLKQQGRLAHEAFAATRGKTRSRRKPG